ncbi:hypothetical protein CLOLEP_02985 [[Clostridium] leptum DSM 753]|uniref:Uncharacterized protein n=1 Tax=[Clostridium] leptum DSM 753 TaxID=428125 RepID=A7VWM0_9FIRM|nr:hypothetical protein CLOLEP_02985 [[Clostridium] leptum DSM 753]
MIPSAGFVWRSNAKKAVSKLETAFKPFLRTAILCY